MPARSTFTINLKEGFPHLPGAPIVEAVIHWRALAAKPLKESAVPEVLQQRFGEYECQEQQEIGAAFRA